MILNYILIIVIAFSLSLLNSPIHASQNNQCDNPVKSFEVNTCLNVEAQKASQQLEQYYQASLGRFKEDEVIVKSLTESRTAWEQYLKSQCSAVWDLWRHGSIRNSEYTRCTIALTKQRTHFLWHTYLTFADSTPPLLPEPEK